MSTRPVEVQLARLHVALLVRQHASFHTALPLSPHVERSLQPHQHSPRPRAIPRKPARSLDQSLRHVQSVLVPRTHAQNRLHRRAICRVRTLPTVINVSWRETAPDALLKYVHHVRPPIGDIRVKPRQREEKPAVAVAIVVAAANSLRFTTLAEIPPLSAAENHAIFPEERRRKKRPNSRADAGRDSVPAFATRRRSPA